MWVDFLVVGDFISFDLFGCCYYNSVVCWLFSSCAMHLFVSNSFCLSLECFVSVRLCIVFGRLIGALFCLVRC